MKGFLVDLNNYTDLAPTLRYRVCKKLRMCDKFYNSMMFLIYNHRSTRTACTWGVNAQSLCRCKDRVACTNSYLTGVCVFWITSSSRF